jgi:DNA helicase-2/ATP-dependent DNA helicase PcrA
MIIAGAGSGKTRVLTFRLAHLIQAYQVPPHELLALTFTNKAAREMRSRIEHQIGAAARSIVMGTFHSIFSRILRIEADKIGYTRDFTIYDDDDSHSLIKAIIKELNLDDKKYKPKNIQYIISNAKNKLISPEAYNQTLALENEYNTEAGRVYQIYAARCLQANAMDFDDLLFLMAQLLTQHPEVAAKYQRRFRYIMVDEYQDTNHAQYIITRTLAESHQNLVVVGDDAQSIYSFRGADIENILSFEKDYPHRKLYKLEQNYRSTGTIVAAANMVIAKNSHQIPKVVFTENETGHPIQLLMGQNDVEEAIKVVDYIRELKMVHSLMNKDFAILYRTNFQSRAFEDSLRRAFIPYRIFGGLSFYKRKEVKDIVAYLRLAINPDDEEAFKRVINYPARGIGDGSVNKLMAAAQQRGCSLWQAATLVNNKNMPRVGAAIEQFVQLIEHFRHIAATQQAAEAVRQIAKQSGILKELFQDKSVEGVSRYENVQEVIHAAQDFCADATREDLSLAAFLSEIALFTDADLQSENDDYVTLMTIHSAKGLEFKYVFVVGVEERLFPGSFAIMDRAQLEEERRLFYVAITRAEKGLVLSFARQRFRNGTTESSEPSRFLYEIPSQYLKITPQLRAALGFDPRPAVNNTLQQSVRSYISEKNITATVNTVRPVIVKTATDTNANMHTATNQAAQSLTDAGFEPCLHIHFETGMRVEHNKFGIGIIKTVEGKGADQKIQVDFGPRGIRHIMIKYARLKVL